MKISHASLASLAPSADRHARHLMRPQPGEPNAMPTFRLAPIAKPLAAAIGVLSGAAWDAGQTQADRQASCP